MTREEEIGEAARKYIDTKLNLNKRIISTFIDGVQWADENPRNVWHGASEEPKGEYEIMCQDEFESVWLTNYRETIENYKNGWEECAYSECIVRWAYVSDLLPKGGEK